MKQLICFGLLISLSCVFSACSFDALFRPIDYPPADRSRLKGPKQSDLTSQPFTLTPTLAFPYPGEIRRYGTQYILRGHSDYQGRLALIESGIVTELAPSPPHDVFADETGQLWGITTGNKRAVISRYTASRWEAYATLSTDSYYYNRMRASSTEFRLMTSQGLLVWDVQRKAVKQTLPVSKAALLTKNYSVGKDAERFTLYDSQADRLIGSWTFSDYVATREGISNEVWGAFETAQGHVYFVVKDANWDGVLLRYDGTSLQKLSLIPVGLYDSGRSVSGFVVDKRGNIWLKVDSAYHLYSTGGQWIVPKFDAVANDYQVQLFADQQGNLTLTDDQRFYVVND